MKSKTFDFLRKLMYRGRKNVHPKTQKKKRKEKNVDAKFFNGENAILRYTVTTDFKMSRGNESQAIKLLPVCNSVKIINSYCVPLHRAIFSLICGLTVEILSFG